MEKLKIVIAEDHLRYREAIVTLLNKDIRFQVIGETSQGDAVIALATELSPDIVLMDVKLDGKNGIDATREIKEKAPHVKIIGLSLYDHDDQQQKMLAYGASAYLDKKVSIEELMSAIVRVQHEAENRLSYTHA